jgi:hypothetical protein
VNLGPAGLHAPVQEVGRAKIEVTLDGKLADGRDKIEGNDDTAVHGCERSG